MDWCLEMGLYEAELTKRADLWLDLESRAFEEYRSGRCSFQEQRRMRVRRFLPDAVDWGDEQTDEVFEDYLRHYRARWSSFPDVEPTLSALREQGKHIAVLTNGDYDQQADKLTRIGIDGLVDDLFASSRLPAAKPEAECYTAVSKKLGLEREKCFMVGDDLVKDVKAAQAAGWSAVWLLRGGSAQLEDCAENIHSVENAAIATLTDLIN